MDFREFLKPRIKRVPAVGQVTVFCTEETLPWPLQVVHPDGLWGAIVGTPQVMSGLGDMRLLLASPMEVGSYMFRGQYGNVVAHVGRRRRRDSHSANGPDLEPTYVGLGAVEQTWLEHAVWTVRLELFDVRADAKEAGAYLVKVADRLAVLAEGLVADEGTRRCYFPGSRQSAGQAAKEL